MAEGRMTTENDQTRSGAVEVTLLPCPFCGGAAKLFARRVAEDSAAASVECLSCRAGTDCFEDAYAPRDEAIAAWNTRALPLPDRADADALTEARAIEILESEISCKLGPETAIGPRHALDAMLAFARSASQPQVPDGMALVPVEPTEAMLHEGARAPFLNDTGMKVARVWSAMLAAAPKPGGA